MALCSCKTTTKNQTLYTTGKCLGCEAEKAFYESKNPEIIEENAELQPEAEAIVEEVNELNLNLEDI